MELFFMLLASFVVGVIAGMWLCIKIDSRENRNI